MKNPHIDQVRQSLLDTLADLRNKAQPMDIERAKAVAQVASVLVDTAKVENDYLKITGNDCSEFMQPQIERVTALSSPFQGTVTRHRLQG
jgi:hypothetical protein